MHGGIWTLCIDLRDDEIRELGKKGFPAVAQCFNYLAGNVDSRSGGGDEPRADWQHSESQSPLRPHLSRYNNNVSKPRKRIPELNLAKWNLSKCVRTFLISGMKLLCFSPSLLLLLLLRTEPIKTLTWTWFLIRLRSKSRQVSNMIFLIESTLLAETFLREKNTNEWNAIFVVP